MITLINNQTQEMQIKKIINLIIKKDIENTFFAFYVPSKNN